MKVLVAGGTGYLGQFVVDDLKDSHEVSYTYHSSQAHDVEGTTACSVNLADGTGLSECFGKFGPFRAVINCAAISQPGLCEQHPDLARAVNIPHALVSELQRQKAVTGVEALLVHISTDQVYDGGSALSSEAVKPRPLNVYGLTKLDGERLLAAEWPRHVSLRSSIIVGPQSRVPVSRPLFAQFVAGALAGGAARKFFEDEWRSYVLVFDIVRIISHLISHPESAQGQQCFNMGGPARLSRVEFARMVARHCKLPEDAIMPVPAASVQRAVKSPADISMDSSKLESILPFSMTSCETGLAQVFHSSR